MPGLFCTFEWSIPFVSTYPCPCPCEEAASGTQTCICACASYKMGAPTDSGVTFQTSSHPHPNPYPLLFSFSVPESAPFLLSCSLLLLQSPERNFGDGTHNILLWAEPCAECEPTIPNLGVTGFSFLTLTSGCRSFNPQNRL